MIDFFSLPKDILIHIYQYDPTYYEVYNQVLQSFNRTSLMKDYLENEKKESTLNISLFLYVRKHFQDLNIRIIETDIMKFTIV